MSLKLQILMALLSCAAVKADCDPEGLLDGQVKCTSCFGYTTCEEEVATATPCDAGTTCFQDGDTNALCVSPASHECVTCPAGSLTACDPFDPYQVVACAPGQAPIPFQACDPMGEVCQNGACVEGTTPDPGSGGGTPDEQCSDPDIDPAVPVIIPYKPECTSGLVCFGASTVNSINCTEGQYFDPRTSKCESLPVNSCDGQDDGFAPFQTDCSKYVACKGGEEMVEYDCDPPEYVFDEGKGDCVELTDDFVCPSLDGCTFESDGSGGSSETTIGSDETTTAESGGSETTTSSSTSKPPECTADNVNQRYPVEGDCKSYWVCRKTSSDTYAYIEAQCSGDLVYNPETTYCDLPENVPGCEE